MPRWLTTSPTPKRATRARLEAALKAAHLWDFVLTLPEGLETPIGANGSSSRAASASAWPSPARSQGRADLDLRRSHLGASTPRASVRCSRRWTWQGRKTLIVIAHRLSTIRAADCIHVLGPAAWLSRQPCRACWHVTARLCGHGAGAERRRMKRRTALMAFGPDRLGIGLRSSSSSTPLHAPSWSLCPASARSSPSACWPRAPCRLGGRAASRQRPGRASTQRLSAQGLRVNGQPLAVASSSAASEAG